MKVVSSTCLAHGIEIKSESGKPAEKFEAFVQRHYTGFCEDAIRCMFTCGFVPWRLRKLDSGAWIPETIPLGTFVWSAERNTAGPTKRKRHSTEALSYKIRFVQGLGIKEDDVAIYSYVKPMGLYAASLQSPLSGIVGQCKLISR
jgi:hypothetical protein